MRKLKCVGIELVVLIAVVFTVTLSSCKREGCMDETATNYAEKAQKDDGSCEYNNSVVLSRMLADIGDGIILPRYQALNASIEELKTAISTFSSDINESNLIVVQEKLRATELIWQGCSTFEFGPAEDFSLRNHVNTFPTDPITMETKITSGSYDLSSFLATGYKGLPALDYLLHHSSNTELVAEFQASSNRISFLQDMINALQSDVQMVYNGWLAEGDNYIATFKGSTGSDVSSPLSLLVNQFNFDYELIKNAKVGIPLGKQTLGTPMPDQCEAYYGGHSAALAVESLKKLKNLYHGISETGTDQSGLEDYLIHLQASSLSGEIDAQFQTIIDAMENVPDPMAQTINTNQSILDEAYEEIKKLVVLIKTDMSSEMEVQITYSDGDGD